MRPSSTTSSAGRTWTPRAGAHPACRCRGAVSTSRSTPTRSWPSARDARAPAPGRRRAGGGGGRGGGVAGGGWRRRRRGRGGGGGGRGGGEVGGGGGGGGRREGH